MALTSRILPPTMLMLGKAWQLATIFSRLEYLKYSLLLWIHDNDSKYTTKFERQNPKES